MATLLGVDVGGTFTDLVWCEDETGEVVVGKQPTSPEAPEHGVVAAVETALSAERIAAASLFLHGTTVGLNALLERRGAHVGLISTRGFRDVLEVRRGDRDDPYDLFWRPPAALVPRHLRATVVERVFADGSIHTPIDLAGLAEAVAIFEAEGVDAVAVALLNAYANGAHELAVADELRRLGFDGELSLSHRVSGEYREYERTCTTVIDAFVRRRMGHYLERLQGALGDCGFAGESLITRSGGGAMTFEQAAERPFETVISGPVAGAVATAELARQLGLTSAISADVGGTSFDTCLVTDGQVPVLYQGSVVGLPIQTPWVDVRSIGAGGGSIAHVGAGGLLHVGPQSAGAVPGPACYGRGGSRADGHGRRRRARHAPRRPRGRGRALARAGRGGTRAAGRSSRVRLGRRCRARHAAHRRRGHGRRDPEHHGRAGPRSARGGPGRVRGRRAAVRHAHGRRARHRARS